MIWFWNVLFLCFHFWQIQSSNFKCNRPTLFHTCFKNEIKWAVFIIMCHHDNTQTCNSQWIRPNIQFSKIWCQILNPILFQTVKYVWHRQKNAHSFLFQHGNCFACNVFARGHIRFGIIKKNPINCIRAKLY